MTTLTKSSGISLPIDTLRKIDKERGDVPRSKFITKILEQSFRIRDQTIENNTKNYEQFNVVSDTGDSIFSPTNEEISILKKGQIFVSEEKIEGMIQKELAKRLGAHKKQK